ncbi:helix-turn-helix domain-containing protein [Acidaminobacter sp. JC074]|nr:helix-turn-helix domain-containing protein [Acidaminobacter sp. JC074]
MSRHRVSTITVEEAAAYLGISIPTLRSYYLQGVLPCIRVRRGGRVLFRTKSLDDWMDKMEEDSYRTFYDIPSDVDYIE